jgi:hypothetical protein
MPGDLMTKGAQVRDSVTGVEIVGYEDLGFAGHPGGRMPGESDAASVTCSLPMDQGVVTMEGPEVYGG